MGGCFSLYIDINKMKGHSGEFTFDQFPDLRSQDFTDITSGGCKIQYNSLIINKLI